MAQDYYEMLGVPRTATSEELQRAYRTLARRYHPDVNRDPGAGDKFKELNEAYHVLADPEQRARYDRFGPDFRQMPEDVAAGAARGPRSYRSASGGTGGGRVRRGTAGGSSVGINIEDLFGGGAGGFEDIFSSFRNEGPLPGADQEAELPLTVEDAFTGGKHRVVLTGPSGPMTFNVTVPAGVTDGQRIRLSGQGGDGRAGGPPGDLYLRVRILPDERFRVEGRDIYVDAPVAPWEAALGATVPVATPGGEAKVRVPAGTSSSRRLRLAGEGMPNPRGKPGDVYAEVRIVVPRRLHKREKELFEELSRESSFDPRSTSR
ncbi:MAG: curved DNA-binding protein [Frankiales bacterium]|nr:curved DNA-binding protein [Frankiales bacterium]